MPDERPPMWIGHVSMRIPDVAAAKGFFLQLGMRDVVEDATDIAILELRAGTHLILRPVDEAVQLNTPAAFDLMVDDIESTHAHLSQIGLEPSQLDVGSIHTTFTLNEPNGHLVTYYSSHNTGLPV